MPVLPAGPPVPPELPPQPPIPEPVAPTYINLRGFGNRGGRPEEARRLEGNGDQEQPDLEGGYISIVSDNSWA